MGIAERIEAGILHHFDTGLNLWVAEGVTLSELVLVFADTVDEEGRAVEQETLVAVVPGQWPRGCADAVGCVDAFRSLAVAFDDGVEIIKIGLCRAPQLRIVQC